MSEVKSRAERLRERQEHSNRRGGGFQKVLNIPEDVPRFKRAIEEQQRISVVPFIVTSKTHPEYDVIMKDAEQYGDPASAFKMDYYVHNVPGMGKEVICRNMTYGERTCPVCAERARLIEEGHAWDSPEVRPFNAKHRTAHVVCLLDEPEQPLAVMDEPWGWWGKVLEEKAAEQNVLLLDETKQGQDLQVFSMEHSWKNDKGEESKMAGKASIRFIDREFGFEEDMAEIDLCSFFTIDSAEDIYDAFHGLSSDTSDSAVVEEEEIIPAKAETPTVRQPAENSRRGRGRGNSAPTETANTTATPVVDEGTTVTETPRRGRGRGAVASAPANNEDEITF